MKAYVDYVWHISNSRHKKTRGLAREYESRLWNKGFHWGEWLIPSFSKNGYGIDTIKSLIKTKDYVAPIYAYYTTVLMAETACVLGKKADEEAYRKRAAASISIPAQCEKKGPKGAVALLILISSATAPLF